ncbi:MAG: hypothetical protein ABI760_22185 [Ferruginibacter sp.]
MGLCIYYKGSIISEDLLEPLIEEVTDICRSLGWRSTTLDGIGDDDNLRGVCFGPEKSEPIFLTFIPGGRLCSPVSLMCREIYDGIQFEKELMYTAGTKTQFAGPDAHIAIIKLLKYISKKYLKDFTLTDEGDYWETGDEKILYAQFGKYNFLFDVVGEALGSMQAIPGETAETLAERIGKILNEKFNGNKD